jgi:uncharacterized protein
VPYDDMERMMSKVRVQKGIVIEREEVPGAGHMFANHLEELEQRIEAYLDRRLPLVFEERKAVRPRR